MFMQTSTSPKTTSNNFFYKLIRCTKLVYLYISSKTFNMAGLEIANIVIANDKYREQFKLALIAAGIHNPGYFSVPAFLLCLPPWRFLVSSIKRLFGRKQGWVQLILPSSFSRLVCRLWWRNLHVVDRLPGNEHQRRATTPLVCLACRC